MIVASLAGAGASRPSRTSSASSSVWWMHLVAAAEVGVLVGERVEAVRAARRRSSSRPARSASRRSARRTPGTRTRCPSAAPGRRCSTRAGRGSRSRRRRPAAAWPSTRAAARARSSKRRRAADPVEDLGRAARPARAPARRAPSAQSARSDCGLPHGFDGALDVAQHRLGLGREARLDHHQVAAQVDDVVDVLDRDRALVDAGAAGDAVPDHLVGHARSAPAACRSRPTRASPAASGPSAKSWSRRPMISSFGDSALPVL